MHDHSLARLLNHPCFKPLTPKEEGLPVGHRRGDIWCRMLGRGGRGASVGGGLGIPGPHSLLLRLLSLLLSLLKGSWGLGV